MTRLEIQNLLNGAIEAQRRGDLAGAETACRSVLRKDPGQPDALQFLGLIAETRGELETAETLMRQSLAANPTQPHVLNNLGNLLHKKDQSREALIELTKAVNLYPQYGEAWFNLGKIYFDLDELEKAKEAGEKAKQNWSQKDPKPQNLLGNVFKRQDDYEQSARCFEEALSLNPNYFNSLHNYGLLLKLQQKPEQALKFYDRALKVNSKNPVLYYNMGNAFLDLAEYDRAIEFYQKALDLKPELLPAHEVMNEIIWRDGQKDKYLLSYPPAIAKHPKNKKIRLKYIEGLLRVGKKEECKEAIQDFFDACGQDSRVYNLLTKIQIHENKIPEAVESFEKGIEIDPESLDLRKEFAKLMIRNGLYQKALDQLEKASLINKFHQEIIAYRGLCWRLMGDERHKSLNNYGDFVKAYKIDLPTGYKNLTEFNQALNKALDFFHTSKMQPSDQSLRGGTQSMAELLFREVKEIQELRKCLETIVRKYISELPDDPEHPLLSRKSSKFTFSGSWSIRLKDQGFHVNHVHPEGWISACYYVSLPEVVKKGEGQQGWIKFGESPLRLGTDEVIGRIVQPKEGLLVLFPSYMWHGTVPFSSKEPRTTLPFDAVPTA